MNQTTIGKYIARKRKEQNLTQEQLAQQLGNVSCTQAMNPVPRIP